jgi:hypothetical protein
MELGMRDGANLFCHSIESNAVFARDVVLIWVVFPRTENQDTTFGDGIK